MTLLGALLNAPSDHQRLSTVAIENLNNSQVCMNSGSSVDPQFIVPQSLCLAYACTPLYSAKIQGYCYANFFLFSQVVPFYFELCNFYWPPTLNSDFCLPKLAILTCVLLCFQNHFSYSTGWNVPPRRKLKGQ